MLRALEETRPGESSLSPKQRVVFLIITACVEADGHAAPPEAVASARWRRRFKGTPTYSQRAGLIVLPLLRM